MHSVIYCHSDRLLGAVAFFKKNLLVVRLTSAMH